MIKTDVVQYNGTVYPVAASKPYATVVAMPVDEVMLIQV